MCSSNKINPVDSIVLDVKNHFELMQKSGCGGIDCSKDSLDIINGWGNIRNVLPDSMDILREDIDNCRNCRLSEKRTNIVSGEGSVDARLVFVGDVPGFEEDKAGTPFVDEAGHLLTKIIQAMDLSRESVYITYLVKCRPPGSRSPMHDELECCLSFFEREVALIKPDIICTLGPVAAKFLLRDTQVTSSDSSDARNQFYDYNDIKLLTTSHPSLLLKQPEEKRTVWEDMKKIMNELK